MGVVFQRAGAGGFRKSMLVWHSVPSRRSSHLSAAKPKPVRTRMTSGDHFHRPSLRWSKTGGNHVVGKGFWLPI